MFTIINIEGGMDRANVKDGSGLLFSDIIV